MDPNPNQILESKQNRNEKYFGSVPAFQLLSLDIVPIWKTLFLNLNMNVKLSKKKKVGDKNRNPTKRNENGTGN